MTDPSDGMVVARVLAGQREAFGTLVERYQDRMIAYVRYMGFDEAQSMDLTQDAFVRAYRHLHRCGDPDRFEGWLFKIVSNVCRTAGRRRSARRTEPLDAHRDTLAAAGPGPEEITESDLLKGRVRRALGALVDDQREALVLMYLQGRSVAEISTLTGASPSAVKMRLRRGREALRGRLEDLLPKEASDA